MEDAGVPEDAAHQAAYDMSPTDVTQVMKDLVRAPKIIYENKITGVTTEVSDTTKFGSQEETLAFIKMLSQGDDQISDYLQSYLHQGGFLHAAEILLMYYFRTELEDTNKIMLNPENRTSKFIVQKDGSLTFEESFDIDEIKTTTGVDYRAPEGRPIASVKMRSNICVKEGKLCHDFSDVTVVAKDEAAKKLFEDPRNPLTKFIHWVKDVASAVFSKAAREHQKKVEEVPKPSKKL